MLALPLGKVSLRLVIVREIDLDCFTIGESIYLRCGPRAAAPGLFLENERITRFRSVFARKLEGIEAGHSRSIYFRKVFSDLGPVPWPLAIMILRIFLDHLRKRLQNPFHCLKRLRA